MTFEEAEAKFRQLQARVQRGETISRADYEDQVSQLAVQDNNGVLWEINPRNGKWMYFDGAEWISGTPPGHDTSVVVPMPGAAATPASTPPLPVSTPKPATPPPFFQPRASASPNPPAASEPVPAYKRVGQDKKPAPPKPPTNPPSSGEQKQSNVPRSSRREWIPFAIAGVVFFLCALLVIVGYNVILPAISPKATPTAVAKATAIANTAVPTIVRLPSPTPIPPTPIPVSAKISSDTPANVRNKPTVTGSTILTKLKKDTQITLIAAGPVDGANQWYQINLTDNPTPGWIRSDVFQIVSGDPKTLPVSGVTPTPTPKAVAPQAQPTATVIGVIPPTPKR